MQKRVLGGIAIVMLSSVGCARLECALAEKGLFPRLLGRHVIVNECSTGACLTGDVAPIEFDGASTSFHSGVHDGVIYDDSMMQDGEIIGGDMNGGVVYEGADASWNAGGYAYDVNEYASSPVKKYVSSPEEIGAGLPLSGRPNVEKASRPLPQPAPKNAAK